MNKTLQNIVIAITSTIATILMYPAAVSACIGCQVKLIGVDPTTVVIFHAVPIVVAATTLLLTSCANFK